MAVQTDPILAKIVIALAVTHGLAKLMIWRRDVTEEAEEQACLAARVAVAADQLGH